MKIGISLEDYKGECADLMEKILLKSTGGKSIQEKIHNMGNQEFNDWKANIALSYDKKFEPVREYIAKVRDAYGYSVAAATNIAADPILREPYAGEIKRYRHTFETPLKNFFNNQHILEKTRQVISEYKKDAAKKELEIVVGGDKYTAVDMCEVLWSGWECDEKIWVVNKGGQFKLVGSDHGEKYFVDESFLTERIQAYEAAIESSKRLLKLCETKKVPKITN